MTAEIEIPAPEPTTTPAEVLREALRLETEIQGFYEKAAASSKLLLADVSRVMARLAQGRGPRKAEIQAALHSF